MRKVKIELDQFKKTRIEKAKQLITTANLIQYKNKNSFFYKNEKNEFININKSNLYGVKNSLITQFVFSIIYKSSIKNNNWVTIKYKTINDHLTERFKASINYISEVINSFVIVGVLIRKRIGKTKWIMKLTETGYKSLFGASINSNAYLLHELKLNQNNIKSKKIFFMNI